MVRGYGMANYELGVPATPATVYRYASLTKQFTATAILQLRDRGLLSLTDSICRFVSRCPEAWGSVTITHLLSHTSGIPNHTSLPIWDDSLALRDLSPDAIVDIVRPLPLQFAPGSRFRYSNAGYDVLGLIVERVSSRRYGEYLRTEILAPLGMHTARLEEGRALVPHRATGYYWSLTRFINATRENPALAFASGGLMGTVDDLWRWDQSLYTDRVLARASRDEMFTPGLGNYGYGVIVASRHGRLTHEHSGSHNGFSTFLMRFPTERATVIVLSNSDRTSAGKVAVNLSAILFGAPHTLPTEQPYIAIASSLETQGAAAAIARLRAMRREQPTSEALSEDLLNELGYDLLAAQRTADAVAVFAANVEDFATSANAHDSLGEALAVQGDTARAITHYERALQLSPGLASAVTALQRLSLSAKRP
jgi:CubicO group peptidase (beta-lactamase class C family)